MPYVQEALGIYRDVAEESSTLKHRSSLADGLNRYSNLVLQVEVPRQHFDMHRGARNLS